MLLNSDYERGLCGTVDTLDLISNYRYRVSQEQSVANTVLCNQFLFVKIFKETRVFTYSIAIMFQIIC